MKKQFKNFLTAFLVIGALSATINSCTVSQSLGNSGVTVSAGADVTHTPKTVYACIAADIDKLSLRARNWLFTKFPQIKADYDKQKNSFTKF